MAAEENKIEKKYASAGDCPISAMIGVIGGKWKPVIIWILLKEARRFGDLRKSIPGISVKVLSRQLKELEEDHILQKKVFAQVPPKVEHFLTEKGKSLMPVMESLAAWSEDHIPASGPGHSSRVA